MMKLFGTAAALAVILMTGACGTSKNDGVALGTETTANLPADTNGPGQTAAPADATATQTSPQSSDTTPVETAPDETVQRVKVDITGTSVSGDSGGIGRDQTNTLSETVRNEDGTCSGWEGPGDAGQWTQGLEHGAPVQILDRDSGEHIGDGTITSSSWADVDPSDREQWNCTFVFEAKTFPAESYKIKVADLQPWSARPDPTNPGQLVASVDTNIDISRVSACSDRQAGQPIFEWQVVGLFWADGFGSLCSNGLVVDKVNRPCRPPTVASEYIISVRSEADPTVVFEDASGLLVDVDTLQPDTKVIVDVATGRPC